MPADSFERFVGLGPTRSYSKLARVLGVSKRSITAKAAKEHWQQRLAAVEREARAKTDQKLAETSAAINDRHLRTLRAVQHKALQALTSAPTGTAAQASATLIAAVRAERAIVAPTGEGKSGPTLEELIAKSWTVPAARVEDVRAQLAASAEPQPAGPPPPEPGTNGHGALVPGEN
jgi:hypothetical protein